MKKIVIPQTFKIFVKENKFMGECNSLLGPLYCQYFFYSLRQNILNSPHLFTLYEEHCTNVLASNFNINAMEYREDKNYSIVNFNGSRIDNRFDKENVKIINFTNYFHKYENAINIVKYAPYDFHIYSGNTYELSQVPRYNSFNFSVFCNSISDITDLLDFWRSSNKISGNLYCFHLSSDINGLNEIVKPFLDDCPRKIQFFDLRCTKLDFVLNILKNSVFSLHYDHNLIYSFWAIRLKCYPVVLKDDVVSKYIKHLDSKEWFPEIVDSFWYHRKELAELIKSLDKIIINKFNVASIT